MAEGKPSYCEFVPTTDNSCIRFRVRLDPQPTWPSLLSHAPMAVVAGCKCTASCILPSGGSTRRIIVTFYADHEPVLEGAAKVSAHMVFIDKTGSPMPSMGTVISNSKNKAGYVLLAPWTAVTANCVVDNYFDVLCSVNIGWTSPASSVEKELPDLGHELAFMFDKQELTDVSFHVGGESFSAHRLVLATRSPVFRAELYGPTAESKMTSITIQDMEACTFRSMLHYMYHGSLADVGVKDVSPTMAQYQHLIVAADRYRVEGLKKICEDKLCGSAITIDSVVSMLELAEDHVCPKLKASCFDFLADGDNFKMVATSSEYLQLMLSFPPNRFKIAHEKPTISKPGAHKKTGKPGAHKKTGR